MRSWTRIAGKSEVRAVRKEIEAWRSTRVNGSPMPGERWESAARLAQRYGTFPVARALPVDFGALRRRVEEKRANGQGGAGSGAGQFVEVDASRLVGLPLAGPGLAAAAAVVELSRTDGARLTVRLGCGETVDVIGLAGAFLRCGR